MCATFEPPSRRISAASCHIDFACRSQTGSPDSERAGSPKSSGSNPEMNTHWPARTPRANMSLAAMTLVSCLLGIGYH